MSKVYVTINIDGELKKQADELFSDFGLTLNAAVNAFLKQAVAEQRIPLEKTRNAVVTADDTTVAELSKQIIDENRRAYEELSK